MDKEKTLKTFKDRLKRNREKMGLSQKEAADELGVNYTRYNNWETGKSIPTADSIYDICLHFKVSADELLQTQSEYVLEIDEAKIVEIYRSLSPGLKNLFKDTAHIFQTYSEKIENIEKDENEKKISFPVYLEGIFELTGNFLDSNAFELYEIPERFIPPGANFAIKAIDDSMRPYIAKGETVFIKREKDLKEGDLGVFILNGSTYLRKYKDNSLIPANKDFETIELDEYDDLKVVGKILSAEMF